MAQDKYILVKHYCQHAHIEDSFLLSLHEYGLVKIEKRENDLFMNEDDISEVEKNFRLHNELGINFEGLDALNQMLKRMRKLEKELNLLQKKIRLYE